MLPDGAVERVQEVCASIGEACDARPQEVATISFPITDIKPPIAEAKAHMAAAGIPMRLAA